MFTTKKLTYKKYLSIVPMEKYKYYLIIILYILCLANGIYEKAPHNFLLTDLRDVGKLRFYDYIFPFMYSLILSLLIRPFDLSGVTQNLSFLGKGKTIFPLYYLFILFTTGTLLSEFISCLFFFEKIGSPVIILINSIRFVPNIIFIGGMFLVLNAILKNTVQVITGIGTFLLVDYFFQAGIFKYFSIGLNTFVNHMNNNEIQALIYNRFLLMIIGILLIWLGTQSRFINHFNN